MTRRLTRSPEETRELAAAWVQTLPPVAAVCLHGDLGAGKTCFVQGMARGLGWDGAVTSPTYGFVQEYSTDPPLVHVDLYRLDDPRQIWSLGLEEWLEEAVMAVEWSERVPDFWPADAWHIHLEPGPDPESRTLRIHQGEPAP